MTGPEIMATGISCSVFYRDCAAIGKKPRPVTKVVRRNKNTGVKKKQLHAQKLRRERLLELSHERHTISELARIFGCSESTIIKDRQEIGLTETSKCGPRRRASERLDEILKLRERGLGAGKIAQKIGFSKSSVARVLRGN